VVRFVEGKLFPIYAFHYPKLGLLGLKADPFSMLSSLGASFSVIATFHGCRFFSFAFGLRAGSFGYNFSNLFTPVANIYNDTMSAYYVWEKENLALKKSRLLA